MVVMVATR